MPAFEPMLSAKLASNNVVQAKIAASSARQNPILCHPLDKQ